jgi:formylmethanofuran dehydrogenase subunit E
MLSLDEYIAKASAKGPPMPGIILGIRMSLLAMKVLEIDDPSRYRRKLIVVVETDRCLPDVIEMVVGCRLGNRTLKFRDWGKFAASFLDLTRSRAFRVAARESIEAEALPCFPELPRDQALTEAYKAFEDEKLFQWQPAIVKFSPEDLPGYHAKRVLCAQCGEGIGFHREVHKYGLTLCRACAGEAYWLPGETV